MAPSVKFVPRSLTQPGGAVFLDPAHRVSREELDRRDARWRALRERAYARAWSDDATLVGSVRYYAASTVLREFEERTLGRSASANINNPNRRVISAGQMSDEGSTLRNGRTMREGGIRRTGTESSNTSRLVAPAPGFNRRQRRFRNTLRRWVGAKV